MSNSPFITDINEANFQAEIIERSFECPVLVDFWAEWCQPCKMVLPILETLAESYNGLLRIAKINTEEQQELASQFQIRGIPTLKLYVDGQPVQETSGAQSEVAFRAMIDPYIKRPSDAAREEALTLATHGDLDEAMERMRQIAAEDPGNPRVAEDMVHLFMAKGDMDSAAAQFKVLPQDFRESDAGKQLKAQIDLADATAGAPDVSELEARVQADANDLEAWFQLALHYSQTQAAEKALDALLEVIKRDPNWEGGKAKESMLNLFELIGPGEVVSTYRRKMFTLMH